MNHLYESLADLLEYPTGDTWAARLESGRRAGEGRPPAVSSRLAEFIERVEEVSLAELQEQYTMAFDLNPVCTLDIGYHLFGENYKRGLFLANLRETEAPLALRQEYQLPDYLPVLLRLLEKLEDAELRRDLILECLTPALGVMAEALDKAGSLYANLIGAVDEALKSEASAGSGVVATTAWRRVLELPVLQGGGI